MVYTVHQRRKQTGSCQRAHGRYRRTREQSLVESKEVGLRESEQAFRAVCYVSIFQVTSNPLA